MARPRTLRSLVAKIGDSQLIAFWNLRNTICREVRDDRKLVRDAIRQRIRELRTIKGGSICLE
jgi:hypothetical protein